MSRIFFLSALDGPVAPMAAYIYQRVSQEHEIAGLLRVTPRPFYVRRRFWRRITPLKIIGRIERATFYRRKFARRDRRIDELLFGGANYPTWPPTTEIPATELNSPQTVELLKQLRPDVLFVFGAPLLKPEIFTVPTIATVNLHLGISPWYRGEHTIFFPLLFQDYERIGFTLHRIDRGVDTGAVLAQGFPALEPQDEEATILAKMARLAANLLSEYLRQPAAPGVSQQVFGEKGKVFNGNHRHFWHDLKLAWRRRYGCGGCTTLPERRQTYFDCPLREVGPRSQENALPVDPNR